MLARHPTAVAALREAAGRDAGREAYVEPAAPGRARRALTVGQWDRAADGVAGLLQGAGVSAGDVVALALPSCIEYAVCYAAAQRLGAITSGINPRLGAAELASIADRARPVVVVVDPDLQVPLPQSLEARVIARDDIVSGFAASAPSRFATVHTADPVALVWTSGTTGRPKGAVFDHGNLAAAAAGVDVLSQPGDRRLSPLPFAHVAYMTRVWDEIAHSITTVLTPTPWRAAEALDAMVAERVTVAQGVPTQWALLLALENFKTADLSSLRIAATGAAPMPGALVAELRHQLGVPVVVRYTSTETSLGTGTRPGDPDDVVARTVGRPVPGVELSIVDDAGLPVPPGTVGMVRLRSAAAMQGYWADRAQQPPRPPAGGSAHLIDAAATASVRSADGWISTGDFGHLDGSGNLVLVGREHERYIRGGYNVYPAEVEEVLASHPGVSAAAVVGVPDPVMGEVGVAFVAPVPGRAVDQVPGLDELRGWCATRLADYKAPDSLIVLPELPVTPMMKVDKAKLAAEARAVGAGQARRRVGRPSTTKREDP